MPTGFGRPTRRQVLGAGAATALVSILPRPLLADHVSASIIEAARKEGTVKYLSAGDIGLVTKIAKAFEAKYPGIKVQAERLGSERIFQRVDQEYASNIHNVDVIDSADAAHFLLWKRKGWLAPFVPDDLAKYWPASDRDPDGLFASFRASMSAAGYNSKLVPAAEAPKSFADMLDPKWNRKIVKAHPSYSGTVTTVTFLLVRELGWSYLEQLAKQRVMHVQSATEPPKKLALGERAIMFEGTDYVLFDLQEKGNPVEAIYPIEGTPLIPIGSGVMKDAPNPNAARLFQNFLYTIEAQQMIVDIGNSRSFHPEAKDKAGRRPMKEIKVWRADPAEQLEQNEALRRRYSEIFGT